MTVTLVFGVFFIALGVLLAAISHYLLVVRRSNAYGTIEVRGFFDWVAHGTAYTLAMAFSALMIISGSLLVFLHLIGFNLVSELSPEPKQEEPMAQSEISKRATHYAIGGQTENSRSSRIVFGKAGESNSLDDGFIELAFGTCIVARASRGNVLHINGAPNVSPPAWSMNWAFAPISESIQCSEDGLVKVVEPISSLNEWQATHIIKSSQVNLRSGPHRNFPWKEVTATSRGACVMIVEIDEPNWMFVAINTGEEVTGGFMQSSMVPFSSLQEADSDC